MSCSGRSPGLGCSANSFLVVLLGGALLRPVLCALLLDWRLLLSVGAAAVGHRAIRRLADLRAPRSRRAIWVSHRAARRDEPPQGDADWAWQGDLCAARFFVSARSDRARAVSRCAARGLGRDQKCREAANVQRERAGVAAASPAQLPSAALSCCCSARC